MIAGNDGADIISGGSGADTLSGDADGDTIHGDAGDDVISGGAGNDVITGDAGADYIDGGTDADTIDAGADPDIVDGGADNDLISGGTGDDSLGGGGGADFIDGAAGADTIYGDSGYDAGGTPTATPVALHAADIVEGGPDNDTLHGEGGNDLLGGSAGDDTIEGGDGDDEIRGDSTYDALGDAKSAVPTEHGDDTLDGNDGNDTIFGEGGNDTILGGDGDDLIHGDISADALYYFTAAGHAWRGDDTINGGNGSDSIFSGARYVNVALGNDSGGYDTVSGDAGDDVIIMFSGSGDLSGGAGADSIDVWATDPSSTTTVAGGPENDHLRISPTHTMADTGLSDGAAERNLDTIHGAVAVAGGDNGADMRYVSLGGTTRQKPGSSEPCAIDFVEQVKFVPTGDRLELFDDLHPGGGNKYTLTSSALIIDPVRPWTGALTYATVETLDFLAGPMNDHIIVQVDGALPDVVTLDGGGLDDNYVDFQGSPNPDQITVGDIGGYDVPVSVVLSERVRSAFEIYDIQRFRVQGEGGDDVLYNKTKIIAALEGDAGEDLLVSGRVDGTLSTSALEITGGLVSGPDQAFLLGGAQADKLFGAGFDLTLLPDHSADLAGNIFETSSDHDVIVITGSGAVVVSLGANDCINGGCGFNTFFIEGSASIDVCSWLYATFFPVSSGNSVAAIPADRVLLFQDLVTPPVIVRMLAFHNPEGELDVNADGWVSPLDALLVINALNTGMKLPVPSGGEGEGEVRHYYYDVNGDGRLSPIDALRVINRLNSADGEGESASVTPTTMSRSDQVSLSATPPSRTSRTSSRTGGSETSASDPSPGDATFPEPASMNARASATCRDICKGLRAPISRESFALADLELLLNRDVDDHTLDLIAQVLVKRRSHA